MSRRNGFASVVNKRNGGILLAASAVAAAAWQEIEHRRVLRADLPDAHIRIERLSDLVDNKEALAKIEEGLRREWGDFALLGFEDARHMAADAGQTIFIASEIEDGIATPKGALQTVRVETGGDPERLRELHGSFADLTSKDAWQQSRRHGGDTAVLLQITVFDKTGRGGGLGSLLRDAVLHMLPDDVLYGLTATPADGKTLDLADKATFNPAMRFHVKGGATPTILLDGYKPAPEGVAEWPHGQDVMVMRYARDDEANWPVPRPEMKTRSAGPLELRVKRVARRLVVLGHRGVEKGRHADWSRGKAAGRRAWHGILSLRRHRLEESADGIAYE